MPETGGKHQKRPEPRRHHFVPNFYLKRFANQKNQVIQYDRERRRGYSTSVTNCAVETDFYQLLSPDGTTSNDAEEFFSLLEAESSAVFRALDAAEILESGPESHDRLTLAIYIAFQFLRTREARDLANQLGDLIYRGNLELALRGKTGEAFVDELTELAGRSPTTAEIDAAKSFIADPTATKILPSFGELFPMMVTAALDVAPSIAVRPWTMLLASTPTFLTTDRPVTFWRDRQRRNPYTGVGLHNADAVYFALDPRKMLVIGQGEEGTWAHRSASRAEVRNVNAIVADWSYRFIFHHPKYRPIDERRLSSTSFLITVNGQHIDRGANLWNSIREDTLKEGQS